MTDTRLTKRVAEEVRSTEMRDRDRGRKYCVSPQDFAHYDFFRKTQVCETRRPIFYHLNGCKVSCPGRMIPGNRCCCMALTGIYISLNFFTDWISNGK